MPRVPFDPATDYYQLLGLKPGATSGEIQAAYRRLAKTYHPDLHAGSAMAAARMARVNAAKSVLLDRDTRAIYDRVRAVRHPVARAAVAHAHQAHVVRQTYRYAPPEVIRSTGRPRLDRTTGVLLVLVLPLLGALLLYVVEAVQMAGQPLRSAPADVAMSSSIGRPVTRSTADVVWLMVHAYPPSLSLAQQANNLIVSRNDQSPDGELLRAVGRHLLQAGRSGDAQAWQAAVAEVCVLASRC
jgi:phage terminase large subunit-like protein